MAHGEVSAAATRHLSLLLASSTLSCSEVLLVGEHPLHGIFLLTLAVPRGCALHSL